MSGHPNLLQNKKRQYLEKGLSYFVYLLHVVARLWKLVLSCRFSWVWSCMCKVLWYKKSPIPLERVAWFCWFFVCIYLHLVRYPLKLQKSANFGWRSQAQALRTRKLYEVSNWFIASIEATKNMLFWVMTSKYSWLIGLMDFLLLICLTC